MVKDPGTLVDKGLVYKVSDFPRSNGKKYARMQNNKITYQPITEEQNHSIYPQNDPLEQYVQPQKKIHKPFDLYME